METPDRKRRTCEELRESLRKLRRKTSGTKAELEERLEEVFNKNDRGWLGQRKQMLGDRVYLASGAHRHVYQAVYEKGPRKGQGGVQKVFKTGSVYSDKFFNEDIHAVSAAGEIIEAFNASREGVRVYLNKAEVWQAGPDQQGRYEQSLVEPLIEGTYRKFNSNTGFADQGYKTMQALSHFSYHFSEGKRLLCDLQGGYYPGDPGHYILTDPVICSVDKQFGTTDLGVEGIENFFHYHICNEHCRRNWMKPEGVRRFHAVPGTTFGTRQTLTSMPLPPAPQPPSPPSPPPPSFDDIFNNFFGQGFPRAPGQQPAPHMQQLPFNGVHNLLFDRVMRDLSSASGQPRGLVGPPGLRRGPPGGFPDPFDSIFRELFP